MPNSAFFVGATVGGGPGGGGDYSLPTGATDPILWLKRNTGLYTDAGTTPVASNGDLIYQWNDQSGNNYHAVQATSANRPKWNTTTTYDSVGTVEFIHADVRYFTLPDALGSALSTAGVGEIFIVLKSKNADTANGLENFGTDTAGAESYYPGADGLLYNDFGTTTRLAGISPPASITSAFRLWNSYSAANAFAARLDGVPTMWRGGADSNTVGFRTTFLTLGTATTGALNAYVSDVIVYPRQLTDTQRGDVTDAVTASTVAIDYTAPRFFRIRSTATWTSGYLGIATFEARTTTGGTDYAATATPAASFAYTGFPATGSNDANDSTFWTTGPSTLTDGSNWLMFDFGATARNITEVKITVRPDGFREDPKDFVFEASYDGGTWFSLGWSYTAEAAWSAGEQRTFTKP